MIILVMVMTASRRFSTIRFNFFFLYRSVIMVARVMIIDIIVVFLVDMFFAWRVLLLERNSVF